MLRFLPDGWLEFLLRPFILMDPSAGIYFEEAAPDLRFAAFVAFLVIALLSRRGRHRLGVEQGRLVLAMTMMFYVWTFVIGNGRYFAGGLLLIGPLLVMAWRQLPGTLAFRGLILASVAGLQVFAIQQNYIPNHWGLVRWKNGPGLPIEASPLRTQPAVFLTITGISYSILVPKFHPASRWANIAGQHDITPGTPEYPRLKAMLASDLPVYLVAPLNPLYMSPEMKPIDKAQDLFSRSLAVYGLALTSGPCSVLRSKLTYGIPEKSEDAPPSQGFWFCPVKRATEALELQDAVARASNELVDVFERIEQRCPRFFPPGNGLEKHFDGIAMRHYPASDVRLYVDASGKVGYRYFRAINATLIGTVEQVRRGEFEINCDKLPGRYRLPWAAD
jgi:hypothetical protein